MPPPTEISLGGHGASSLWAGGALLPTGSPAAHEASCVCSATPLTPPATPAVCDSRKRSSTGARRTPRHPSATQSSPPTPTCDAHTHFVMGTRSKTRTVGVWAWLSIAHY
jgi:hypothetical protein